MTRVQMGPDPTGDDRVGFGSSSGPLIKSGLLLLLINICEEERRSYAAERRPGPRRTQRRCLSSVLLSEIPFPLASLDRCVCLRFGLSASGLTVFQHRLSPRSRNHRKQQLWRFPRFRSALKAAPAGRPSSKHLFQTLLDVWIRTHRSHEAEQEEFIKGLMF